MGRDTTASKRMAAKRSREKAAGLRRLNVAVVPEIFEKLTVLMKQHSCTSQAQLIELLVMHNAALLSSHGGMEVCNEVTAGAAKLQRKSSETHSPVRQKKSNGNSKVVTPPPESLSSQMSLF